MNVVLSYPASETYFLGDSPHQFASNPLPRPELPQTPSKRVKAVPGPLLLSTLQRRTPHSVSSQLLTSPGSVSKEGRQSCPRQQIQRENGPPSSPSVFSFDVLRSDPASSSLQHIASSVTFPNRGGTSTSFSHTPQGEVLGGSVFRVSVSDHAVSHDAMTRGIGQPPPLRSSFITSAREPDYASAMNSPHDGYSAGIISFPAGPPASSQSGRGRSPDDPDVASDGDFSGSHNGKKHVCLTCSKRFNRPSSLRIHVNTHTGATPFRCPWPNCAREFNVNSNMRRHYRNHTTPAAPRPQAVDNRRRRKRGSPSDLVFISGDSHTETHRTSPFIHPPIASQSMEHDSEVSDDEEDELDSSQEDVSPVDVTSRQYWEGQTSSYHDKDRYGPRSSSRYSQSHVRSGQTGKFSSASPSPPLRTYTYSPSAPYSRSFDDSKVSTALRPAFHSKPVSTPLGDEPMLI
ncbi:hypothetical protein C0992_003184 [Termitomyces sp. T32_za158]|nr:hypothetical protein C0992_003184 [Termitomyces sp. T32_za158]